MYEYMCDRWRIDDDDNGDDDDDDDEEDLYRSHHIYAYACILKDRFICS